MPSGVTYNGIPSREYILATVKAHPGIMSGDIRIRLLESGIEYRMHTIENVLSKLRREGRVRTETQFKHYKGSVNLNWVAGEATR